MATHHRTARQPTAGPASAADPHYDAPPAPATLPSNVRIQQGDILLATEDVICHQCNCSTPKAKGLAQVLFDKYPHADMYAERRAGRVKQHTPGMCVVLGEGTITKPFIANMFAQVKGGKPKPKDTANLRMRWFDECLRQIPQQVPTVRSLALPYLIGCGLAGGDWTLYLGMICRFATANPQLQIVIYQLTQQ
eukprot:TRINITY_DN2259_c1_g3_i1.p1 TRINITY_DN2259_c1_g3~~TRINITY_DN2259_c1_g3_i1.p1  ORF type:complete len:193 (+),score=21.82 TRINITY_DN2259_c1_g3_i1:44-622(+)